MGSTIFRKYGIALFLLLLTLLTLFLLSKPIIELPFLIAKDPNEGWNALHAERLFSGKPLYPDMTELISNNYPPLSFYIVGTLGSILGDNIIAGRLIALTSFLIVGLCIGNIVYRLTQSLSVAIFSSLFFITYTTVYHENYIGMDDPQWLAHAVMMIALLFFLPGNQNNLLLSLSLILMLLAGLIKHNLIPIPTACTIWLFIYNRTTFYRWLIYLLILLSVILLLLYYGYGLNLFLNILKTPRIYSFSLIIDNIKEWLSPLAIYMVATVIIAANTVSNRYFALIYIMVVLSLVWGVYISGGVGVDCNAFFDLIISLSIVNGLTVHWICTHFKQEES